MPRAENWAMPISSGPLSRSVQARLGSFGPYFFSWWRLAHWPLHNLLQFEHFYCKNTTIMDNDLYIVNVNHPKFMLILRKVWEKCVQKHVQFTKINKGKWFYTQNIEYLVFISKLFSWFRKSEALDFLRIFSKLIFPHIRTLHLTLLIGGSFEFFIWILCGHSIKNRKILEILIKIRNIQPSIW